MGELHIKFGKLLAMERERKNLKLADLSEELKISVEHLEAIEAGDKTQLPADLYYRLFAKSYSERLGIDFQRTTDAIKEDIGEDFDEEPESTAVGKKPPREKKKKKAKPKGDEEESEEDAEKLTSKSVITWSAVAVAGFALFVVAYLLFFDQGGSLTGEGAEEAEETRRQSALAAAYEDYDWTTPEADAPEKLRLKIVASQESWSTVVVDGDTTIYQTLRPWREYTVEANYRLLVSVGIPRNVTISLNDQEVDLVDPETRRISRVEINQANFERFLNPTAEPAAETIEPTPPPQPRQPATTTEETTADNTDGNEQSSTGGDNLRQNRNLKSLGSDSL